MSDTILSGDFTVYYMDDNRRKQIKWTGSTGTYTMNQLYSALLDLFDESLQMDDGIPMSAQTPVEYTVGKIDAGDNDPWFIDNATMEHLTGGALRTTGWARTQDSNTGIVVVPVTSNTIVSGDIGYDITHADLDSGTLLDIIEAGTIDYLVIRPDSYGIADSWNSVSGVITEQNSGTRTATQDSAAVTGEQIWANLYSIGTIESDTHLYLYQGIISDAGPSRTRLYATGSTTQDWWSDGHIDICVPIKDFKTASFPVIDGGYITVLARKFTTLYDNFEVSTSTTSGGRNPIPMATAPDLDNTTGYKAIRFTASAGNWAVGDEMAGNTTGARGVITQIDVPGATQRVHYYLVDDPLTDFAATEALANNDDTGTGDMGASSPWEVGPARTQWYTAAGGSAAPSATYTATLYDVDDDGTSEYYAVNIDCNAVPLTHVYEWIKYTTRRGELGSLNTDVIAGEMYIGGEVYLKYSGAVSGGTLAEGDDVTQTTSGATGIIMSHDTTNKVLLLRNTRGTFSTTATVTSNDNSGEFIPNTAAETFSPKKSAPLGSFAGGTFFGARGVLLSDWATADENAFQLTPIEGGTKERPTAITIEVTNLVGGSDEALTTDDRVSVFRLTGSGGEIDKDEYLAVGGETPGVATLDATPAMGQDVPGKTTGGVLRIRDYHTNNVEYRMRYSSWSNVGGGSGSAGRFVLDAINVATTAANTASNVIYKPATFGSALRGDLVYNYDQTAVSYITSVTNASTIQISPTIPLQNAGDHIKTNCMPITVNASDSVYVPLIDEHSGGNTTSVSIVYDAQIYFKVVVRNSANATPIVPFSTSDTTSGTNRSVACIRTEDTIKS